MRCIIIIIYWRRVQCDQGIRNLSPEKAHQLSADDPDYATRDLYNAIARGDHPSWTVKIQIMTFDQAEKFRWNPFDLTKVIATRIQF